MSGISDQHPEQPTGYAAANDLIKAYIATFSGQATKEQAEVVLTDLARETEFYSVAPEHATGEVRAYKDGKRAAFAYVFAMIRKTDAEIRYFEEAARKEQLAFDGYSYPQG